MVDTHIHLISPDRFQYHWIKTGSMLDRAFTAEDYAALHTDAFIAIEASVASDQAREEFLWLNAIAAHNDSLVGIVAFADLTKGAAVEADIAWLQQHGGHRLKAIRYVLGSAYRTDPRLCLESSFMEGLRILARYDLPFEIACDAAQLPVMYHLVTKCPQTRFILEHIGKPDIAAQQFEPWQSDVQRLASQPNIVCKVSNLIRAGDGATDPTLYQPYFATLVSAFKMDRLMFGSDAPVMLQYGTYDGQLTILQRLLEDYTTQEQQAFWHATAQRIYNLMED